MSDFQPGEVPDVAMVTDGVAGQGFGDYDMGPERVTHAGKVGATDIPDQWSIPHFKPEEQHLTKLFGTMNEEQWVATGVELRRSDVMSPMAVNMMRDMMTEVVYQMKARNNSLTPEQQGVVKSAAVKTRTEVVTVHQLPEGSRSVFMEVLDDLMEFDNMSQLKEFAQAIVDGVQEKWS